MRKIQEKCMVLQYQKKELEKLRRKQLYMDIGIFVLHGEMVRKENNHNSDYKVYINLENMQFTYIPINNMMDFEMNNVIIKRNIISIKEEWDNIKELSNWYKEELEFHTTGDAIKNLLRLQNRR